MRVLLYGMQSSGASAVAYTMAQRPGCVAFVDIWNMFAAPVLDTQADVIAKVVITTAYPLSVHKARFKPDITILVLRHPVDNYHSLLTKSYANENGLPGEKFRLLEAVISENSEFDRIFYYEDLVFSPSSLIDFCNEIGWTLDHGALLHPRNMNEIRSSNAEKSPEHIGRVRYGMGQFKQSIKRHNLIAFAEPAGKAAQLWKVCPNLLNHYQEMSALRGAAWYLRQQPLLSCKLDRFVDLAMNFVDSDESGQISINPNTDGSSNGVRVGGLPGSPFNHLTGIVYLKNLHARDIQAIICVEDSNGNILARQTLRLSHSGLANFSLPYQALSAPIAFYLGAVREDGGGSPEHDTLYFEDLCLDYIPA